MSYFELSPVELFGGVIDASAFGENLGFGFGDFVLAGEFMLEEEVCGSGDDAGMRAELLSPCAPATITLPAVRAAAIAAMAKDLFMHHVFHDTRGVKLTRSAR